MKYSVDSKEMERRLAALEKEELKEETKTEEVPQENEEEQIVPPRSESPEDNEAIVLHEKKKIEEAIRES